VKRVVLIGLASAALAALIAPVASLGQSAAAIQISESSSTFPDRSYIVELPKTQPLTPDKLTVTENGGPVVAVGVQPPGESSGAILLIDASNSMEGEPIEGAMAAARAFLAERKDDLPVAIVVFGPEDSVLAEFTTDAKELSAAVAEAPPLAEGTHIYDALIKASEMAKDEGLERTTIVLPPTAPTSAATRAALRRSLRSAMPAPASSRSAFSRPNTIRRPSRRSRSGPAARTSRARPPGHWSRSSRRSASSSRASTR
jgi:hypothetical protein